MILKCKCKTQIYKVVKSCGHVCNSPKSIPIFWTNGLVSELVLLGMALHSSFFFPKFYQLSQPFNHLFSSPLNRLRLFSSLLLSMSLIKKTLKHSHNFCPTFQVLIFLHATQNWKYNRLLLTYLWSKFHLCKNQVIYLKWQSEWKIPVEERYFQ